MLSRNRRSARTCEIRRPACRFRSRSARSASTRRSWNAPRPTACRSSSCGATSTSIAPGSTAPTGKAYEDNAERFIFFSRAVMELARRILPPPEIIHVHDWQTALLPVLIKDRRLPFKTVLTIHNIAYQGTFLGVRFRPHESARPLLRAAGRRVLRQHESAQGRRRLRRCGDDGERALRPRNPDGGVRLRARCGDPRARGQAHRHPEWRRRQAVEPSDRRAAARDVLRREPRRQNARAGPRCSPSWGWRRIPRGPSSAWSRGSRCKRASTCCSR